MREERRTRRDGPLPLEARRVLWRRLWDRLLQPCAHERAATPDPETDGPGAAFDAGRMAWGDARSAAADDATGEGER